MDRERANSIQNNVQAYVKNRFPVFYQHVANNSVNYSLIFKSVAVILISAIIIAKLFFNPKKTQVYISVPRIRFSLAGVEGKYITITPTKLLAEGELSNENFYQIFQDYVRKQVLPQFGCQNNQGNLTFTMNGLVHRKATFNVENPPLNETVLETWKITAEDWGYGQQNPHIIEIDFELVEPV